MCCVSSFGITAGAAEVDSTDLSDVDYDEDFNADSQSDRQKILELEKNLPEKPALRDYNGKNYVTPLKLQNPYGSCWAFAMAAAAEISYLYENDLGVPAGEVNDQVDNLPIKAFLIPARTVTECLLGDADLNNNVDIIVVTMIRRYDFKLSQMSDKALMSSDVDFDGSVNIIDATWIQRRILNMKAPESIGETVLFNISD